MELFFADYPDFNYNPSAEDGQEFRRLRKQRRWRDGNTDYTIAHTNFMNAFREKNRAPLKRYLSRKYPSFQYNTKAPPEAELERLKARLHLDEKSDQYLETRRLFEKVYNISLNSFFSQFRGFKYNPGAEAKAEFERLREFKRWYGTSYESHEKLKWRRDYWEYRNARKDFFDAFVEDFSCFFGKGDTIRDWVYLCDVLGVRHTPRVIEDCRLALQHYYVNIYDLYDHVRNKSKLLYHVDLDALSLYSLERKLYYPLGKAKTTCMKFLLRRLIGEAEAVGAVRVVQEPDFFYDDWSRQQVPRENK